MDIHTAPPPSHPTKTLQKQWLEALGALHYVLAFLFLGERRGRLGCLGTAQGEDCREDGCVVAGTPGPRDRDKVKGDAPSRCYVNAGGGMG